MSEGALIREPGRELSWQEYAAAAEIRAEIERETIFSQIGFVLFLLVNAALFVRPAEMLPLFQGWPIYEVLILACLAVSWPRLVKEFSYRALRRTPISVCVLLMLPAVALSHLWHVNLGDARDCSVEFLKLVLYYMALVAQVNTLPRLKWFMTAMLVFTVVLTGLSLLDYYGAIHLPQMDAYMENREGVIDDETGKFAKLARLNALGIFHNPNDLSRILVVGMLWSLCLIGDKAWGWARFLWVAPLVMLGCANALTYSRGGLLGLLAGLGMLFYFRFGLAKAVIVGLIVLPTFLMLLPDKEKDMDLKGGTGHERILLWREGFEEMKSTPLFGTGMNTYADFAGGLAAHNSFVHAYVELGLFGGTLFVGLTYFGMWPLFRSRWWDKYVRDRELFRIRSYMLAILMSYAVGMESSARCYSVPTYLLMGAGAACCRLVVQQAPPVEVKTTWASMAQLALVSLAVLLGHYVFVRVAA